MAVEDSARQASEVEALAPVVAAAARRWRARKREVASNRRAFDRGVTPDTEERLRKFREHRVERAARVAMAKDSQAVLDLVRVADLGKERILNDINDMVSVEFLERGLEAALAVGRVNAGAFTGTGFLVGPNIMLTNHHVLPNADEAMLASFDLDAEENQYGDAKSMQRFNLCPNKFWAASKELDFAFVAVEPASTGGVPIAAYGWHPLIVGEGKIRLGEGVSIIQHPAGNVKMVALHNARLIQLRNGIEDEAFCFYTCDTDRGSSGSPVFNSRWEVIALHHASVPETNDKGRVATKSESRSGVTLEEALKHPEDVSWIANEGVRVSRLVAGFRELEPIDPSFEQPRRELLDLWTRPDVLVRSRPQPQNPTVPRNRSAGRGLESAPSTGDHHGTVDVPITLSIRIGAPRSSST